MKTSTLLILIFTACGGLAVVLIAACAGAFFFLTKNVEADVSPRVDALFAAIDRGTFGATYLTETTPELRKAVSRKEYEDLGRAIKTHLGPLRSKTLTRWNAQQFNAESYVDAAYTGSFEKGSGAISTRFKKVDGQWRLLSFLVTSNAFFTDVATEKCPYCGELNPPGAKFCSSCGKPLTDRRKVKSRPK